MKLEFSLFAIFLRNALKKKLYDKIKVIHMFHTRPPSGLVPIYPYKVHISHRNICFFAEILSIMSWYVSLNSITHSNINTALSCNSISFYDKAFSLLGNSFVPTYIGFVPYSLCTLNFFSSIL